MNFDIPGWTLLGQYPLGDPDGVGSWILHQGGEAALLELPPNGQLIEDAVAVIERIGVAVKYVFVSHRHEDHFDQALLRRLMRHRAFASASWIEPRADYLSTRRLELAGEPLWLVYAPKHSRSDMVTIFRGFAMTGDIELGTVHSANREVRSLQKRQSLRFLADFERAKDYRIHGLCSAHLNDFRTGVDWPSVILPQE